MRVLHSVLVTVAMGAAIACGDVPEEAEPVVGEESESVPAWVGDLAVVANAIEARPAAADSILAAHDMTRPVLDSLLYEVAADPALTAAYREARER